MGFVRRNICESPNRHIWQFLRYYLELETDPKYAVLVDGPWGAGKSHLVQLIIDDHFRGWRDEYVKVSLFGLGSVAEIDEAVFAAVYPMLNSPGSHVVGGLMKAGLNYLTASTEIRLQKLLSNKQAKVYIFDDLERCELEVSKTLGYINKFVEHVGARVIIIGDQSRLDGRQQPDSLKKYESEREKLVGRTLMVQSCFDEAFSSFATRLTSVSLKNFIEQEVELIHSVFQQSGTANLRLLQLALWDFERLYDALDDVHRQHRQAMQAVLSQFFAFAFEVKQGRLSAHDVEKRDDGLAAAVRRHHLKTADGPSGMELADIQYPEIDLRENLLSNQVLVDVLFHGVIRDSEIRQSLDRSKFFAQLTAQPVWLRMIHFLDLHDHEFELTFAEMERQFYAREITVPGEILHVISHRLWLARHDMLAIDVAEVFEQSKQYIDSLRDSGTLDVSNTTSMLRFGSHAGYVFGESESAEFQEIWNHLKNAIEKRKVDSYPSQALALLKGIDDDPDLFARRICVTNSTDNAFTRIPVLASIAPDVFVERLLAQEPTHQQTVMRALGSRYEAKSVLENELKAERPWLSTVKMQLLRASDKLPRLSKMRVKLLVKWHLSPVLDGETS